MWLASRQTRSSARELAVVLRNNSAPCEEAPKVGDTRFSEVLGVGAVAGVQRKVTPATVRMTNSSHGIPLM